MSNFSPNNPEQLPQQTADLIPRDAPPTPPSPEEAETDFKSSRKREREVSLEPATPKTDDAAEEPRKPAPKKKNRMSDSLETTHEEDEAITPPDSPNKLRPEDDPELMTSPPYETKVRQISRKVKGMKWDDRERDRSLGSAIESSTQNTPALGSAVEIDDKTPSPPCISQESRQSDDEEQEPSPSSVTKNAIANPPPDSTEGQAGDSDSDDQDKKLKRKMGDRMPSVSLEDTPLKRAGPINETSKRSRDSEEDENPREKKRPTPPPESNDDSNNDKRDVEGETAAPQPKVGGFLAYAATSSPFASAKGPSVFGQKSTPSPSPLAGTSNGSASSFASAFGMKPSSPFAISKPSKPASSSIFGSTSSISPFALSNGQSSNALSTSPTGTKRSGFEAFSAASSPFAAASRSRSPPSVLGGLARSKSPPRRGTGTSVNAFKSYVGTGSQGFSAPSPPVKKQRQDLGEDTTEDSNSASGTKTRSADGSAEGSEEESEKADRPVSFRDQLRASSNALDAREGSEEDDRPVVTEQEVQTGEEEEDTVFQVRGKLYALSAQNSWKERGTGLLKLNVRKSDGGGARLVMRKEAVYALLLNVTLFKGMRCTLAQDPRYVRFSCIESGATVHYNLRLSNTKVAGDLIEEITANIPGDESEPEPTV